MSDENEIYQKWLRTPEAERGDVAEELSGSVKRHAQAVVWKKLHEIHPDLVQTILAAVMTRLETFKGQNESKFSTWVHAVAEKKAYEDLRKRRRYRAVFDESVAVVADIREEEEPDNRVHEVVPSVKPNLEGSIAFAELSNGLSDDDAALLDYKRAGFSSREAAELTGATVEAIDSRWARLKPRLGKKFHSERRKCIESGN